jgi:hypothetical protein
MQERNLKGGRIRSGRYDEFSARLEIEFVDGAVTAYKGVPREVWQRLCAAPNAAVYLEDRIADEYPSERGSPRAVEDARARLDDLFGPPPASPGER